MSGGSKNSIAEIAIDFFRIKAGKNPGQGMAGVQDLPVHGRFLEEMSA
jgi:hypothetical protein